MCVYIAFTMGADLLALIFALVVPQCWFRMRKKYEGIPGATKVDIEVQDAYASTMGRSILDIVNSMHIFFILIYQPIIDAMVRRRVGGRRDTNLNNLCGDSVGILLCVCVCVRENAGGVCVGV
jgi:hypothetical protein